MRCYLCQSESTRQIHDRCRDSAEVRVLRCEACGLVFLSDARANADEFYERSGMYDFAMPSRETLLQEEAADTDRRARLLAPLVHGKRYLDFGCGAGAVLLAARAQGAEAAGVELNQQHREALTGEHGVRVTRDLAELEGSFDVVSLFHVLEHLKDPVAALRGIRERLAPGGQLVVEVPHADDALLSVYESENFKNFTYWTCHLYLFTEATLAAVLRKAGFDRVRVEFTQRYPLANHLYWLAKGKPGGHKIWAHLGSPELDAAYAARLAERKISDTLVAFATAT